MEYLSLLGATSEFTDKDIKIIDIDAGNSHNLDVYINGNIYSWGKKVLVNVMSNDVVIDH